MQKYSYLFVFLIFAGCISKYKPPHAVGKTTEVVVLCKDETWNTVDTLISDILEQEIHTPTTEQIFNIKKARLSEIDKFRYRKNCLILGVVGDEEIDSLISAGAMKKLLSGETYFFGGQDLFIKGQFVLIIETPTIYKLKEVIEINKEFIFNSYVDNVRRTIRDALYEDGSQKTVSDRLFKEYGFRVSIPKGWLVAKEEIGFVEFIRHSPDRIISIYWETSPMDITTELNKNIAIELRNEIGNKYYDDDYVDTTSAQLYWVKFNDIAAGKLNGIWQNDKETMGGPFRSYIFSDKGRIYMIDMHVFAPGMKKWKYIEQLETIGETFKL